MRATNHCTLKALRNHLDRMQAETGFGDDALILNSVPGYLAMVAPDANDLVRWNALPESELPPVAHAFLWEAWKSENAT